MSFKRMFVFLLISIAALTSACAPASARYDALYIERKLALPYRIEGVLTQAGEKYEVAVSSGASGFTVEFLSGDVTEGLVVEFFENGVFLFFDDLRFKTNSEAFLSLESLKAAFEILGRADVEKQEIENVQAHDSGVAVVSAVTDRGEVRVYVSKADGSINRLITTLDGANLTLDLRSFANVIESTEATSAPPSTNLIPILPNTERTSGVTV